MDIYEELHLEKIINASDTYTRIGGSRMSRRTLAALSEAAESFADIGELSDAICRRIAERTGNETAFISSGAGACVILTAAACMTRGDETLAYQLPDASNCDTNEIIVFASQRDCPVLPYWHLIELSGARLIAIEDDICALKQAIGPKTAAVFFFTGAVYEWTTPKLKAVIEAAHLHEVPVIVDAAAQLPPKSLMSWYTVELGADAVVFSGGKFINGPQTTGIVLGRHKIIDHLKAMANPNVRIGRPYKVGKEEYAAFYRACMDFLDLDEDAEFHRLKGILEQIRTSLSPVFGYRSYLEDQGRLGQHIPMLYLQFSDGTTGEDCYNFLYAAPDRIDIGKFSPGDPTGDPCRVFINAINLRESDIPIIIEKLNRFLTGRERRR